VFEISPYLAVGDIRFGMSEDELVRAMGRPVRVSGNRRKERTYEYNHFTVIFSTYGKVTEVVLEPESDGVLDGLHVFKSPNAALTLLQKDGDPKEIAGFVELLNLGIGLAGFQGDDESNRSVSVFERGRWDHLRLRMRDVSTDV
jgi:hypothetical protein